MAKEKYKYTENYRHQRIMIYSYGGQWWWKSVIHSGLKIYRHISSSAYHSIDSAIMHARKHIDKKI